MGLPWDYIFILPKLLLLLLLLLSLPFLLWMLYSNRTSHAMAVQHSGSIDNSRE
jgi:hypothetical protein